MCDLLDRRKVASLCMFYKIFNNACHLVRLHYSDLLVPTRVTRRTAVMHDNVLVARLGGPTRSHWLLVVELSSIRGLLSQLVLLFGITLMALFLMVWN